MSRRRRVPLRDDQRLGWRRLTTTWPFGIGQQTSQQRGSSLSKLSLTGLASQLSIVDHTKRDCLGSNMLADLAAVPSKLGQYPRSHTHRHCRQCRLSQREQTLARFGTGAFSLVQHSGNHLPGVLSHFWRPATAAYPLQRPDRKQPPTAGQQPAPLGSLVARAAGDLRKLRWVV